MNLRRDTPIIGIVGFNLLTLFVYVTAPLAWQWDAVVRVCAFVGCCLLCVVVGFGLGQFGGRKAPVVEPYFFDGRTLIRILLPFYVLTFPISYAYRLDFSPFDIAGMLNRLLTGLGDPVLGYASSLTRSGQGPFPWSIYFAVAVFNQLFFVAGFLYWAHLSRVAKLLFVALVGIELFYWIGTATAFGVIAFATTWGLTTMFWDEHGAAARLRSRIGTVPLLALLLAVCIAFFSYNLYRRGNFVQMDLDRFETHQTLQVPLVRDHPAFSVVPEPLWPTYLMVVSYMAQGYHHLSLAFDEDFQSTGMMGNNPAFISLVGAFGIAVWDDTYMHRLHARGIDEFGVWHSAYMWYASDVSFFGVPVVLFCLGYLFGFSWAQGGHGDFLSRIMFVVFGNMLLFLFANNTYLASVFYACVVFVPFWLFTRFSAVIQGRAYSTFRLPLSSHPR